MGRVIHINTKLPFTTKGVELDMEGARAKASNKKYDFYIIGYNVYRVLKKGKTIDLLGSIKGTSRSDKGVVSIAVSDTLFIIVDKDNLWGIDESSDPPKIYLINNIADEFI